MQTPGAAMNLNTGLNPKLLVPKSTPITIDYMISDKVLGLGINGKVVECFDKKTGNKYALKVSIQNLN